MAASTLMPILRGLEAHASGALWLPDTQTALIADIHLGYSWAQRRRGELGPLADSKTREKLFRVRDELRPKHFVFLGDLVHAPRPCTPEREWIEATLQQLAGTAELIAVRGNHDRLFAAEFGHLQFQSVDTWSQSMLTAIHGDRLPFACPEDHTLVLGHLHPSLAVRDVSGAGNKVPVFLVSERCVVLPAFSPFARGYDVACGLPEEIQPCFRREDIEAYAATNRRIVRLGSLRGAIRTMAASDVNAPSQFRKRSRQI